jgi:hypothetical protein
MYFYGLPRKSCKEFNIEKIKKSIFLKLLKKMKGKNIIKNLRLPHGIAFIPHGLLFTISS